MQTNDQRVYKRYRTNKPRFQIEVRTFNWLGLPKKPIRSAAVDFAKGGVSFICEAKLHIGQRILVSIESDDHCLKDIPAMIIRNDLRRNKYHCAANFNLSTLPDMARLSAHSVLLQIETHLKHPTFAV